MRKQGSTPLVAAIAAAFLASSCSVVRKAPIPVYAMGEKVQAGHVFYTVFETKWLTQLGDGADVRTPQNRFFAVRMSGGNAGVADMLIPNPTLVDDDGNSYDELKNGEQLPQWFGYLVQVHPAEATQGNILFDVPPKHYKLRVTDEDGQRPAYIDLPLSFDIDAPEVSIPDAGKKK